MSSTTKMNNAPYQKKNNFRMPAEWEPHSAVWLAWPHDEISWPGRIEKVESQLVKIIAALHQSEQVELLVLDEEMKTQTTELLRTAQIDLSKVSFHITDYMNAWMRDCGGIFVKNSEEKLTLVNWIFNSWGNKFPDLLIDAALPKKVAEWTGLDMLNPGIVLEGGAIDVNGQGTLITTEQCLLNPNRNPGLTKTDYEKYFSDYLGVNKTVWLKEGLVNDHTDGHIDDIARFVSPTKVVCAEGYEGDLRNLFEVLMLPLPNLHFTDAPAGNIAGSKAPASYTNFYIANKAVLVPTYNDPSDAKALEIIQSCFPDRKIVGIDCTVIIYGGGAIHCMTQQQPDIHKRKALG